MEHITKIQNSHKFFTNQSCKYFPCHGKPDTDSFNCLFCYCPLYSLGDDCGGIFEYTPKGIKTCMDCHLPHTPEYYDVIIDELTKAASTSK